MDKGIRQGAVRKFAATLPLVAEQPALKEKRGHGFRMLICNALVEEFGCTLAASGAHYNYAKLEALKTDPTLVSWLGREEGKNNGGRKKKVAVETPAPQADEALTVGDVTNSVLLGTEKQEDEAPQGAAETPPEVPQPPVIETPPEPLVKVIKVKTGEVVCEELTRAQAEELIVKAKEQKKAALAIAE